MVKGPEVDISPKKIHERPISTCWVIRQTRIKATERYHLTLIKVAFIKGTGNTKCEGFTEKEPAQALLQKL